jgi:ADP-ribosylglycohydrolase
MRDERRRVVPMCDALIGGDDAHRQPITTLPRQSMAGQWTDDTSMALCLAESLSAKGGLDPKDQIERYRRWWKSGHLSATGKCFDIGNQVKRAITRSDW